MILVDTNVWSEQVKSPGDEVVLAWLEANDAELALSTLVIAEIHYGIAVATTEHKRTALRRWLDGLESRYWSRTLEFDKEDAAAYGRIAALPAARARIPQVIDMQLAAQAVARGCSIATRNVRDFEWTGVELIDPWAG
ncbi:MAG: hypothetical protein A4S12_05220 [Proteobacteria bacterium SG_bin5]|nr:PIN domain-containing protein [Sphingomonas sp.]OQW43270.1 MAG: hypothetical protein A4S12_05220 [Proteobacteria bacterium SG_bin5]